MEFINFKISINSQFKWRQLRPFFWMLALMISLPSCKIFRPNKTETTNSHTHSKPLKDESILSAKTNNLIEMARTFTGVPYKLGGISQSGMDCSGLIYTICQSIGFPIPRISYQQAEVGDEVDLGEVQKGDLVFFNTSKNSNRISHVGLVTEVAPPLRITFIHASTSSGVREDNLFSNYWKKAFIKATRPFVF